MTFDELILTIEMGYNVFRIDDDCLIMLSYPGTSDNDGYRGDVSWLCTQFKRNHLKMLTSIASMHVGWVEIMRAVKMHLSHCKYYELAAYQILPVTASLYDIQENPQTKTLLRPDLHLSEESFA